MCQQMEGGESGGQRGRPAREHNQRKAAAGGVAGAWQDVRVGGTGAVICQS